MQADEKLPGDCAVEARKAPVFRESLLVGLSAKARKAFEDAKQRGYVEARENSNLARVWGIWCSVLRVPDVAIWAHGSTCSVRMDLHPSNRRLPEEAGKRLMDKGYSGFSGSGYAVFWRVPRKVADALARELVEISRLSIPYNDWIALRKKKPV